MADPTLKDVLDAIAQVRADLGAEIKGVEARLTARIDGVERKVDAVEKKIDGVEKKLTTRIDEFQTDTKTRFDDLDEELAGHNAEVHRKIEEELEMLKKRAPVAPTRKPRPRAR